MYDGNNSNSVCFVGIIWEPPCESWSLPGWFETLGLRPRVSNHPGRDQLSQVGSQMSIITSKHTLLYNYTCIVICMFLPWGTPIMWYSLHIYPYSFKVVPELDIVQVPPGFVKVGSNVSLICHAKNVQNSAISWRHNGKLSGSQNNSNLVISSVSASDIGVYLCETDNVKSDPHALKIKG